MISIIIPAYNEEGVVGKTITYLNAVNGKSVILEMPPNTTWPIDAETGDLLFRSFSIFDGQGALFYSLPRKERRID